MKPMRTGARLLTFWLSLSVCLSMLVLLRAEPVSAEDYTVTCPECGSTAIVHVIMEPTCLKVGAGEGECTVCGHIWGVEIPATGHHFEESFTNEPSCESWGTRVYVCTNPNPDPTTVSGICGETYSEDIPPTGHDYSIVVGGYKAGCTTEGLQVLQCSHPTPEGLPCTATTTVTLPAKGHNFTTVISEEPASCTASGTRVCMCSNFNPSVTANTEEPCTELHTFILDALGHDYQPERVEPTCTEDGYERTVCMRCGDVLAAETLPATGHLYPEEWTVEREAGEQEPGLQVKVCELCGERLEEEIPALDPVPPESSEPDSQEPESTEPESRDEEESAESEPGANGGGDGGSAGTLIAIAAGVTVALAAAGLIIYSVSHGKPVKTAADKTLELPDLARDPRSVVLYLRENPANMAFFELLRKKAYIDTDRVPFSTVDKMKEEASAAAPDLVLLDLETEEEIDTLGGLIDELAELSPDSLVAVIAADELCDNAALKGLLEEGKLSGCAAASAPEDDKLVRLILPLYKASITVGDTADVIGTVADAMGIPFISRVIDIGNSGIDVKETMEAEEIGVSEAAIVLSDIASILGLDTLASVANLVDDVNQVKEAVENEAGSYEEIAGVQAGKDVVDVVTDLLS